MKSISRTTSEQKGYAVLYGIDLVNNRREMLTVNIFSLVLFAAMVILSFLMRVSYRMSALQLLILALMIFLYIPAHELVHGAVMKLFSDERISFGWRLAYAYCGSQEGLFTKPEYITIALAPLIFFTLLLSVLQTFVPFLSAPCHITNIINVSGSAGDIYVVWRMLREKRKDILVNDTGTDMRVYYRLLS